MNGLPAIWGTIFHFHPGDQAGISERSFSRRYAEAAGQTPARAIERLRIDAARRLLWTHACRSNGSRSVAASVRRKRCAAAFSACWPSRRKTIVLGSGFEWCFGVTGTVFTAPRN